MKYAKFILTLCVLFGSVSLISAKVALPHIFSDNMVLQRKMPIRIWGFADAKEVVYVTLNGVSQSAITDKTRKWEVILPAMEAGGPFTLQIKGKANEILFENVLIGDVWLCSGQSNMEFFLKGSTNAREDIRRSDNKHIRLFTVPKNKQTAVEVDLPEGNWEECNPLTTPYFSAVAYYFGKALQKEVGVPIGLINSSWGGTDIETWTSWESAMANPAYMIHEGKSIEQALGYSSRDLERYNQALRMEDKGMTKHWYSAEYDVSNLKVCKLPSAWGGELADEDGVVWFYKDIVLPQSVSELSAVLSLGTIDDRDVTFVNGIEVGATNNWFSGRRYPLKPGILKPGRNRITVKVTDMEVKGGFTGKPENLFLKVGDERYSLAGKWHYEPSILTSYYGLGSLGSGPNAFSSLLYNGMIAPLVGYNLKGVIWYQGENNVNKAYAYRSLFPLMIKDWRKQWGYDFPFIWVQLANFMSVDAQPKESEWAELREAQNMALSLPGTGQVVITDLGEAGDIHPKNKKDVGLRLAANALQVAYGRDTIASGPVYHSMKLASGKIILSFTNMDKGLKAKGNKYGYLNGFAIAGDDRKFVWAKAYIEDDKVIVFNETLKHPVAVRYGWGNNPDDMNLVNSAGYLASPFRTDSWPGITQPVLYKYGLKKR
ncbi:sialate O-acetylesterase [Bacteroides uniformis]|uniref:sialate O-acetylesterase n=1 Tax=Bacteroides uniformis TaxID=820 RepID=UPI0018989EE0|nr:sialate O-acetylesterase [Bacteroides uniformis]MDC1848004.1 sialate O-acetylesterase [Bacteroides uniformis]